MDRILLDPKAFIERLVDYAEVDERIDLPTAEERLVNLNGQILDLVKNLVMIQVKTGDLQNRYLAKVALNTFVAIAFLQQRKKLRRMLLPIVIKWIDTNLGAYWRDLLKQYQLPLSNEYGNNPLKTFISATNQHYDRYNRPVSKKWILKRLSIAFDQQLDLTQVESVDLESRKYGSIYDFLQRSNLGPKNKYRTKLIYFPEGLVNSKVGVSYIALRETLQKILFQYPVVAVWIKAHEKDSWRMFVLNESSSTEIERKHLASKTKSLNIVRFILRRFSALEAHTLGPIHLSLDQADPSFTGTGQQSIYMVPVRRFFDFFNLDVDVLLKHKKTQHSETEYSVELRFPVLRIETERGSL